jgi:hypothetical protein
MIYPQKYIFYSLFAGGNHSLSARVLQILAIAPGNDERAQHNSHNLVMHETRRLMIPYGLMQFSIGSYWIYSFRSLFLEILEIFWDISYWEWDFSDDRNWNAAGCAWRIDRWG